ncbi:MAG: GNAT family N-acetyltransferase, partial [Deltaproteobacteria bacterium]
MANLDSRRSRAALLVTHVRPARRGDRDRLVALLVAQLREHRIRTPKARLARAVDGVLGDPQRGRLLVATIGGRPIGLAALSFIWPLEHGGRSAWLEELYVEPSQRGCGIGRALLRA